MTKVPRWASRVRVRNTSSYTAGPPPRGRKIHPFFRRSIPGRPTLPPPFPFRSRAFHPRRPRRLCFVAPSCGERALPLAPSPSAKSFVPPPLSAEVAPYSPSRTTLSSSSHPPPRIVHIREPPLYPFPSDGFLLSISSSRYSLVYSFRSYPNLNVCTVNSVYTSVRVSGRKCTRFANTANQTARGYLMYRWLSNTRTIDQHLDFQSEKPRLFSSLSLFPCKFFLFFGFLSSRCVKARSTLRLLAATKKFCSIIVST